MGKAFWDFIAPQAQAQQIQAGPGPEFFQQQGRMQQIGLSPDAITSLQGPLGALSSTTPSARPPQQPPQPAAIDRYLPLIGALGGAIESPGGMFTNYVNTRLYQQQQQNQGYRQALAAQLRAQQIANQQGHYGAQERYWQDRIDTQQTNARIGAEARRDVAETTAKSRITAAEIAARNKEDKQVKLRGQLSTFLGRRYAAAKAADPSVATLYPTMDDWLATDRSDAKNAIIQGERIFGGEATKAFRPPERQPDGDPSGIVAYYSRQLDEGLSVSTQEMFDALAKAVGPDAAHELITAFLNRQMNAPSR